MQAPKGSSGDLRQVYDGAQRLVARYPTLFRKLIHWLEEPQLYGRFELQRHGSEKVTFEVSRKQQESGAGSADDTRERSPVRIM